MPELVHRLSAIQAQNIYQTISNTYINIRNMQNAVPQTRTQQRKWHLKIPQIEQLVESIVPKMKRGGRIFYIGAGTSGRLGVLDASEIPPTYGMPPSFIIGLIAGGDFALRNAVENAEDDYDKGWEELQEHDISENDTLIGIAASGTTPYVTQKPV